MSKQWYMTVGYPGGELAINHGDFTMAWEAISADWSSGIEIQFLAGCEDAVHPYTPIVRPCPPDVVEWLEAEMHEWEVVIDTEYRMKVPGGWRYVYLCQDRAPDGTWEPSFTTMASTFVPVPGTANITVLEATRE